MYSSFENLPKIIRLIKDKKIGVIPTDTIYGIVGSALNSVVVEKIYKLRKRATDKPFIILISSFNDLNHFNIHLTENQKKFLKKNWPNPLSVILPVEDGKWKFLHRGKNCLAFRMPKDKWLRNFLKKVGPLVAPSANYDGKKPSENVKEAKNYFENNVDFYMDGGTIRSIPSTLIQLNENGSWKILRTGSYKINL